MNWQAASAFASLASTVIVLAAAITGLRQLRHMRLASQMSAFYQIMSWQQSAEALEGRRFLESLDLSDPTTLREVTTPEIDQRIMAIGVHYQNICRLLNLGVLDDVLFASYFAMAPRDWKLLQPIAAVARERINPAIWIDFEYFVHRSRNGRTSRKILQHYPAAFVRSSRLGDVFSAYGADE
jgi:hypothetical protein